LVAVAQLTPTDKAPHYILAVTVFLELLLQTVVVVAEVGTVMQPAQAGLAAVAAPHRKAAGQIIILDQTTVEILIWVDEQCLAKDFQAARELDLIVKRMIVTKQVVAAAPAALVLVQKTIVTKVAWVKAVQVQLTIS
jgi:hypothetical protein